LLSYLNFLLMGYDLEAKSLGVYHSNSKKG
jgi:hypothetical protein